MFIIKASNNKYSIKLSKSEWVNIGKTAGWWDPLYIDNQAIITINRPLTPEHIHITPEFLKNKLESLNIQTEKITIEEINNDHPQLLGSMKKITINSPIKYTKKITNYLNSINVRWTMK